MTPQQTIALLPLILLAATAVGVMLAIALFRAHKFVFVLTLTGVAASFALLFVSWSYAPLPITPLLVIDRYAIFYMGLIMAATFGVTLLAYGYLANETRRAEEFYLLLLLAALGSAVLVCSTHFVSFFLGLELLSVSLYPLLAYKQNEPAGLEAAIKYLVLAGLSSSFLLFGMALVYAELGTLQFAELASRISGNPGSLLLWTGMGLLMVGFGFKLALVPFHLWTPDVYQGAPAPVTAFVATVSKGAMFALLLRYFTVINYHQNHPLMVVFTVLAVASMVVGNLLALFQNNIKRLLAYSSIAHLGYLLVAFLATGPLVGVAISFYLVAYFITTLGAFGVVTILSHNSKEPESLDDYHGLAWRRPWLAAVFTASLLSLAGIPFSVGFIGKFYVLVASAHSGLWWLMIILVVTSSVGLFYYLRAVVALYQPISSQMEAPKLPRVAWAGGIALTLLGLMLFWLGIYPAPLLQFIQTALAVANL